MKTVVFYREHTDYARSVNEFVEMFGRRYPDKKITTKDLETREGAAEASLYDITQYPAIMVMNDGGGVMQLWQGEQLPLIDEVAAYALG